MPAHEKRFLCQNYKIPENMFMQKTILFIVARNFSVGNPADLCNKNLWDAMFRCITAGMKLTFSPQVLLLAPPKLTFLLSLLQCQITSLASNLADYLFFFFFFFFPLILSCLSLVLSLSLFHFV